MEVIQNAIQSLTPTILIAVVFIGISAAFFLYYWYSATPRKGTLEWIAMSEAAPTHLSFQIPLHPMEKKDILPILLITAVYACTAFFQLGSTDTVQSYTRMETGQSVNFRLSEPSSIAEIRYYTGIGTGTYLLEYSSDGELWDALTLDQSYSDLLKWRTAQTEADDSGNRYPASITAQYFRLTAQPDPNPSHPNREFLELGELVFFDANGQTYTVDSVDGTGVALFDEPTRVENYFWTNSSYFDEIYHARTAKEFLEGVYPYEVSHPPLGKLIISLGIMMFGMNPFGWRFMGVLFGVLMLPLLYLFLKNMFGKTAVSACGTILFAAEFMHLTQTRIATIDTYGVFFILAMNYFLYRWLTIPAEAGLRKAILPLFLSGLMFGLGVASKWTVIYGGVGLAVMWLIGMVLKGKDHSRDSKGSFAPYFWGTVGVCIVFFIAIPVVIYFLSYLPHAASDGKTTLSGLWETLWENQKFMLSYHQGVHDTHPYESRWYQWLVDARPILYFREMDLFPGTKAAFSSFNNPLISWTGLLCVILTVIETFRRKCGKALFLWVGYLAQLLPWVIISRTTFAYHYFPSILFCVFCIAYAMDGMLTRQRRGCKLVVYGFTACAVGLYAAFYPVLIGLYVPNWYTQNVLRWFPSWPI